MNQKSNGFINGFTLKMIAIITMLIDHIGFIFFPQISIFRLIGRISFPIFCFLIVEGFYHTRNELSYFMRLFVFALISEIPFDLAFHNTIFYWQYQNVFFTLALGLLSIFCLEEMNLKKYYFIFLIATWGAALFCHCDYGLGGVLLISLFYLTKNTPWLRFILTALILYLFFGIYELFGLIALIPIAFYNGKRGPSAQMIFYYIYPLHLFILWMITRL